MKPEGKGKSPIMVFGCLGRGTEQKLFFVNRQKGDLQEQQKAEEPHKQRLSGV